VHEVSGFGVHGAVIGKLYRAHCALWVGHTNADAACRGVGQAAADAFGLVMQRPLLVTGEQNGEPVGIGRVGSLSEPMTLRAFAQRVACAVPKTEYGVQVGGDLDALVSKIAVLPGSGDSEFDAVRAANADVYVTSDLRHHPATDALEQARFESSLQRAGVDLHAASADSDDSVDVNDSQDVTPAVPDDAAATITGTRAVQCKGAEVVESTKPNGSIEMRPALINTPHSAIESMWLDYAIEDVPNAVERATGYRLDVVRLTESTDPWQLVLGRD
jgi:hypothetical protein